MKHEIDNIKDFKSYYKDIDKQLKVNNLFELMCIIQSFRMYDKHFKYITKIQQKEIELDLRSGFSNFTLKEILNFLINDVEI